MTIEANPCPTRVAGLGGLQSAGVNRISLGVQSLRDVELTALARGHSAHEALAAFRAARRLASTTSASTSSTRSPASRWRIGGRGFEAAIALAPDHLSLYALQLALQPDEWAAPPRPGALRWRRRMQARQDEELAADQYRLAEELLDSAGYRHYELSSWARPGRESRHNQAYWERRPYTGIGAGAHSFDGSSRSWNVRELDRYLGAAWADCRPVEGQEALSEPTRAFEAVALGLRMVEGFSRAAFAAEFGVDPLLRYPEPVASTRQAGLLEVDGDAVRLTPAGRLLANEVLVAFVPPR